MEPMQSRFSFFLLLCVAFLDFMGVGLVFPLFATLLFDPNIPLLASETSGAIRGLWMGVLIALTPLIQFFFSPILGSLSDQKGRKPMILWGLALGLIAYVIGIFGVQLNSLFLLIFYRALFGVSAATMTVIQASLVDISTPQTKARNFALYNMALGTGFTLGPFLGGRLSDSSLVSWFDFSTPFVLGALFTGLNLILLYWKYRETRELSDPIPIDLLRGIKQAKKAIQHPTLRFAFLGFFFFLFGWDFFLEFVPISLKSLFEYNTSEIGTFYAYKGLIYAISVGLLIRPFIKKYLPGKLLVFSMLSSGVYLLLFLVIKNPFYFWFYLPLLNFILALFYPVASTYVSNCATENNQGEILGIYHSVQALALILSPLCSGSIVGAYPLMPIYLGSAMMVIGGSVFTANHAWTKNLTQSIDEES